MDPEMELEMQKFADSGNPVQHALSLSQANFCLSPIVPDVPSGTWGNLLNLGKSLGPGEISSKRRNHKNTILLAFVRLLSQCFLAITIVKTGFLKI